MFLIKQQQEIEVCSKVQYKKKTCKVKQNLRQKSPKGDFCLQVVNGRDCSRFESICKELGSQYNTNTRYV
jgi:hypothetical protein